MTVKPIVVLSDDNPADVFLFRLALEENNIGCELVVVTNGAEAVQLIESVERGDRPAPNLFLLDLRMPLGDGFSLLQRLRANPQFANTPAITWTSSDAPQDEKRSLELGATRHLHKPSDLDSFMKVGKMVGAMIA